LNRAPSREAKSGKELKGEKGRTYSCCAGVCDRNGKKASAIETEIRKKRMSEGFRHGQRNKHSQGNKGKGMNGRGIIQKNFLSFSCL
jgi:hypothetical protein